MKKLVLLLFQTAALSFCLHAQAKYNINATINGIDDDTVYIMREALNNNGKHTDTEIPTDTLSAHHNCFTYNLPVNEPAQIFIIPKESFYKFSSGRVYLPKTKFINLIVRPSDAMTITGNLSEDYLDYEIKGSSLNKTVDSIRRICKNLDKDAVNYELQNGSLPDDKNKKELSKVLFDKRVAATSKMNEIKLNYIAQHLNNEVSGFLLLNQPLETFAAYYPKLSENVRNGIFKQSLENKYIQYQKFLHTNAASKTIKEGNIAPKFSLQDFHGTPFSLTQIKRKYIVLDFWGSWCGWCIEEFPKMKDYYQKYKSQVEFVSIACNDTEAAWKKSIKEHQLNWKQLINSNKNDVCVLYGVKSFPTKIILNQDFEIIKIFEGAGNDFFQELDKLIQL